MCHYGMCCYVTTPVCLSVSAAVGMCEPLVNWVDAEWPETFKWIRISRYDARQAILPQTTTASAHEASAR
jgi:hypothetical protein